MLNYYANGLIDRWKCLEEAQRGVPALASKTLKDLEDSSFEMHNALI